MSQFYYDNDLYNDLFLNNNREISIKFYLMNINEPEIKEFYILNSDISLGKANYIYIPKNNNISNTNIIIPNTTDLDAILNPTVEFNKDLIYKSKVYSKYLITDGSIIPENINTFSKEYNSNILGKTAGYKYTLNNINKLIVAEKQIEGNIVSGSLNVTGDSAVRRTIDFQCIIDKSSTIATDLKLHDFDNKKVKVLIGIKNNIETTYDYTQYFKGNATLQDSNNIIWFKLGVFLPRTVNIKHSVDSYMVSLSAQDKASSLDGSFGGIIGTPIEFKGALTQQNTSFYDTIKDSLTDYAKEDFSRISVQLADNFIISKNVASSDSIKAGSSIIKVQNTASLYPGMGVSAPGIFQGTKIKKINSSTEIEMNDIALNTNVYSNTIPTIKKIDFLEDSYKNYFATEPLISASTSGSSFYLASADLAINGNTYSVFTTIDNFGGTYWGGAIKSLLSTSYGSVSSVATNLTRINSLEYKKTTDRLYFSGILGSNYYISYVDSNNQNETILTNTTEYIDKIAIGKDYIYTLNSKSNSVYRGINKYSIVTGTLTGSYFYTAKKAIDISVDLITGNVYVLYEKGSIQVFNLSLSKSLGTIGELGIVYSNINIDSYGNIIAISKNSKTISKFDNKNTLIKKQQFSSIANCKSSTLDSFNNIYIALDIYITGEDNSILIFSNNLIKIQAIKKSDLSGIIESTISDFSIDSNNNRLFINTIGSDGLSNNVFGVLENQYPILNTININALREFSPEPNATIVKNENDTVLTILDDVKAKLGGFQYYYNYDGDFIFKEDKRLVLSDSSSQKITPLTLSFNDYHINSSDIPIIFDFTNNNNQLIVDFNNNLDLTTFKNDIYVHGNKKKIDAITGIDTSGTNQPLSYHIIIDNLSIKTIPASYKHPWQQYIVDQGNLGTTYANYIYYKELKQNFEFLDNREWLSDTYYYENQYINVLNQSINSDGTANYFHSLYKVITSGRATDPPVTTTGEIEDIGNGLTVEYYSGIPNDYNKYGGIYRKIPSLILNRPYYTGDYFTSVSNGVTYLYEVMDSDGGILTNNPKITEKDQIETTSNWFAVSEDGLIKKAATVGDIKDTWGYSLERTYKLPIYNNTSSTQSYDLYLYNSQGKTLYPVFGFKINEVWCSATFGKLNTAETSRSLLRILNTGPITAGTTKTIEFKTVEVGQDNGWGAYLIGFSTGYGSNPVLYGTQVMPTPGPQQSNIYFPNLVAPIIPFPPKEFWSGSWDKSKQLMTGGTITRYGNRTIYSNSPELFNKSSNSPRGINPSYIINPNLAFTETSNFGTYVPLSEANKRIVSYNKITSGGTYTVIFHFTSAISSGDVRYGTADNLWQRLVINNIGATTISVKYHTNNALNSFPTEIKTMSDSPIWARRFGGDYGTLASTLTLEPGEIKTISYNQLLDSSIFPVVVDDISIKNKSETDVGVTAELYQVINTTGSFDPKTIASFPYDSHVRHYFKYNDKPAYWRQQWNSIKGKISQPEIIPLTSGGFLQNQILYETSEISPIVGQTFMFDAAFKQKGVTFYNDVSSFKYPVDIYGNPTFEKRDVGIKIKCRGTLDSFGIHGIYRNDNTGILSKDFPLDINKKYGNPSSWSYFYDILRPNIVEWQPNTQYATETLISSDDKIYLVIIGGISGTVAPSGLGDSNFIQTNGSITLRTNQIAPSLNKIELSKIGSRKKAFYDKDINTLFKPKNALNFFDKKGYYFIMLQDEIDYENNADLQNRYEYLLRQFKYSYPDIKLIFATRSQILSLFTTNKLLEIKDAFSALKKEFYTNFVTGQVISINSIPIYNLEPLNIIKVSDNDSDLFGNFILTDYTLPLSNEGLISINAAKTQPYNDFGVLVANHPGLAYSQGLVSNSNKWSNPNLGILNQWS
jgi:hypothetical protein